MSYAVNTLPLVDGAPPRFWHYRHDSTGESVARFKGNAEVTGKMTVSGSFSIPGGSTFGPPGGNSATPAPAPSAVFNSGIRFGATALAAASVDLSWHIDLGSGLYGYNVGGSSVNTIVNGVMSVAAYSGTFWVGPYSAVALRIGNTSNAAAVQFYGPAATNRSMTFYSMIPTLSARWQISVTGTAESGSNAGSDFSLVRFSDTSANLGAAFTINRATGIITQSNGTVYSGGIGATTTDLTKGVSLNSSGVYGFNITAARLNYTHPGGTALHAFNGAGTDLLTIAAAGVSILTALLIPQAPKAGTAYTAAATDVVLNLAPTATFTLTLPAAASSSGRVLVLRSTAAFAVNANSSSVVPLAGGAAVAAILTAAAGKFAMLVSDGTAWQTVMAN